MTTAASREARATERFCTDLTEEARAGRLAPVVGRDDQIDACIGILLRQTKRNPVLVGEPGVGKTSVAEGIAQRIAAGQVPELLRGRRVMSLDLGALMTDTRWLGVFDENISALVRDASGGDVLFVDELHRLVGAGTTSGNPRDACDMLKPALARGDMPLLGATTEAEYALIAQDGAFERRLTKVHVPEPSPYAALLMLASRKEALENTTGTTIRFKALRAAVRLSADLMPARRLPDKAIDIIEVACADAAQRLGQDPRLTKLERLARELEILRSALRNDPTDSAKRMLEGLEAKSGQLRRGIADRLRRAELAKEHDRRRAELECTLAVLQEEEALATLKQDALRAAQIRFGDLAAVERGLGELRALGRSRPSDSVVRERDVARVVSRRTGIPLSELWPIRRSSAA